MHRILQAVNNMLYLIHWNACAYYAISEYEGIGSNYFVYDGQVADSDFHWDTKQLSRHYPKTKKKIITSQW